MDIVTYALLKKNKLTQANSYSDLPENGTSGAMYIAKDTGQTYYWDDATQTYVKTGTTGRTGVYSYNSDLPTTIGTDTEINKADLEVIVAPTVPYSEGSEISAVNAVHALIVSSTATTVIAKTVTDMTIDSFRQVDTINDLPAEGAINILYAVRNIKEFRVWNSSTQTYEEYPDTSISGVDNTQIHVSVSNDNEIEATLQAGSIAKSYLNQALQDEIDGKQDIANIQRHNDVFNFDGSETTFNIPNSIDPAHIDAIFINGIMLTGGNGNDYVIDKNAKTITFAEAWDSDDVAYVKCE